MASPLPTRLMTRVLSVVVVVVLALVLAGCRIEPRVDIDVAPDGSGIVRVRVRLDAAAAAEIGDPSLVRLDDIRAGGWDAPAPESAAGSVTFRASKRFASREQLQAVLHEIDGSDGAGGGLFRDFHLDVEDSWFSTTYSLAGSLHSSGSAEQFSDSDVAKTLDGFPLGRTPEQVTAELDGQPVSLVVAVHLPGDPTTSTDSSIVVAGGPAADQAASVTSVADKSGPIWWFLGAVVAALVATASLALARRRPHDVTVTETD